MSWREKLDAPTGAVSLSGLFDGDLTKTDLGAAPDLDTVNDNLLRPGFPAMRPSHRHRGWAAPSRRQRRDRHADV